MNGVPVLVEAITSLMVAVVSLLVAPATPASAKSWDAPHILARGDRFEIWSGSAPKPIFFRGVNLGAGAPGRLPGGVAFTKADYRRHLGFARDLHANPIRVQSLHPPAFFHAVRGG